MTPRSRAPSSAEPAAAGRPHPRLWARRLSVARAEGRRRLRLLAIPGVVVVVGSLGLGLLHSGFFEARHRQLTGAVHSPPGAVWAAARITSATPLIDIDPASAARRIERLPWVARAEVHLDWPDRVDVSVTERVPVAVIGSGPSAVVVDRTGRVLATVASDPAAARLPVVRSAAGPALVGATVGQAADAGLAVAAAVPSVLAGRVQAVTVGASGWVTAALSDGVSVVVGPPTELRAKFAALAAVLADPVSDPTGPAVVDVTDPEEPTVGPVSSA